MRNEINAFKMYLNSIINEIPVEIHEELWNNLVNVSCATADNNRQVGIKCTDLSLDDKLIRCR
jgi:hypothetical protein